jgi:hypothetical protein
MSRDNMERQWKFRGAQDVEVISEFCLLLGITTDEDILGTITALNGEHGQVLTYTEARRRCFSIVNTYDTNIRAIRSAFQVRSPAEMHGVWMQAVAHSNFHPKL